MQYSRKQNKLCLVFVGRKVGMKVAPDWIPVTR